MHLLSGGVTSTLRAKLPSRSSHKALVHDVGVVKPQGQQIFLCKMLLVLWTLSNYLKLIMLGSKATNLWGKIIISILQKRLQNPREQSNWHSWQNSVSLLGSVSGEWELPEGGLRIFECILLHNWAALRPSTRELCCRACFYFEFLGSISLRDDFQKILPATSVISSISCLSIWKGRDW